MLNNQPMGFHSPSVIIEDARRHGLRVKPIDVQISEWSCHVEPEADFSWSLRLRDAAMYRLVPREEIADSLLHLRGLFRRRGTADEREQRTLERREVVTKNLLSNLFCTKDHPTLNTVLEVADIFSLTLDGAHRLFGYDLERVRDYDLRLNGSRTHIIESYPFGRDALIDLPAHLGREEAFHKNSLLRDLIASWQTNIPIRALDEQGWREPGAFYVRVGTQDSLGSSLPPGSMALVEPVRKDEALRPNPLTIYFLQFGNGYRCSRCVVSRGKLVLLSSGRNYMGTQEFQYPGEARVVGRVRAFATGLPLLEGPIRRSLPRATRSAPLVLPWEHSSLDQLFAAEHLRFRRSFEDRVEMRNTLEAIFHTRLHGRTERRYRYVVSLMPRRNASR